MKNKVCIVTGVGEGNGRSISKRFSKEGYRVAMLARNKEKLDQLLINLRTVIFLQNKFKLYWMPQELTGQEKLL